MIEYIIPAIITGIPGYISIAYILYSRIRKTKKKVKAVGHSAGYEIGKIKDTKSDVLLTKVKLSLLNDRDDSVAITDIVGFVHYNKEKFKKNEELILKSTPHEFSYIWTGPQNFEKIIPTVIKPHEATKIDLEFVFPEVIVRFLHRSGYAKFGGFIGNVPFVTADERQFIKEWDNLPITLYISLHIDGREDTKVSVPLERINPQKPLNVSGTYTSVTTVCMGKKIWDGKWDK